MSARWKPGAPIPERFSGMPVTIKWNEVALGCLLRAIKREYESGYAPMCEAIQEAMRTFTPPKPDEPQGLGAVVLDAHGTHWTRVELGEAETSNPWYPTPGLDLQPDAYDCIAAVKVLSPGWSE